MSQTRILIVIENGILKGASQADGGGSPQPLDSAALAAALPAINAAAIAGIALHEEEVAYLKDFKARAETGIAQIVATIQNPAINATKTTETILTVIAEGTAPEIERKKAAIRKQIEDLQAQL